MNIKIALPVVLAASGLIAFTLPEDRIEFRPGQGDVLDKTFVTEISFSLEDLTMTMNGEEVDPEMMGGDFDSDEASGTASMTLEVSDEYVRVSGGRPLELVRSYESMEFEYELGTGDSDSDEDQDVAGKSVRFKWSDEEGAYARTVEGDEEIEEDILKYLAEDLDMRVMLPSGPVAEGATWKVAWGDMGTVMVPGFDVEAALSDEDNEMWDEVPFELPSDLSALFGDAVVTCTYKGLRTVGGVEVGVIALESDAEGDIDLSEMVNAAIAEEDPDMGGEVTLEVGFAMEMEGELLWNIEGGHAHSMEFEADLSLDVFGEMVIEDFGMDMGAEAEILGTIRRTVTFE